MTFGEEQQHKLKNDAKKWSKILVEAARDRHSFDIPASACTALSNLLNDYISLTEEQDNLLTSYRGLIAEQKRLMEKEKAASEEPKEPRKRIEKKEID